MQEGKTTSSDIEIQTHQMVCREEDKENSSKISLEKIMSKPIQFGFVVLILLALIVVVVPELMVNFTMSFYKDSTMANTHVTTSTNLIIAFVTLLYVWLTGSLVTTSRESIKLSREAITKSNEAIELSKESIAQAKKEQQIRDIEKRLESFYIPAQSTLKVAVEFLKDPIHFTKWTEEVSSYQRGNHNQSTTDEEDANTYAAGKLKEIEKYRFLAKEKTCRSLIKFIYENESTENRLEFSNCVQKDIKDYLAKLYELKHED